MSVVIPRVWESQIPIYLLFVNQVLEIANMSTSWQPENLELMKDYDCLKFVRIILDFYLHRNSKLVTCIYLLIHIPPWALQYYYYISNFNGRMMAQYCSSSLLLLYAYVCLLIPIMFNGYMQKVIRSKDNLFLSLNTVSEQPKRDMLQMASYSICTLKLILFLAVLTYCAYILEATDPNRVDMVYQVTFFKTHFSVCSNLLVALFHLSLIYLIVPMIFPAIVLVYFILQIYFQVAVLEDLIERITANYHNSIEWYYDKHFQKEVHDKLRFCVTFAMELRRICLEGTDYIRNLIVLFSLLGWAILFSFAISWYLIKDVYIKFYVMMLITGGVGFLLVIELAQICESKSLGPYYSFYGLPWYNFDKTNKKIMLCIMAKASDPIRISVLREFPLNRTLIMKVSRVLYTIYTLISSMGKG